MATYSLHTSAIDRNYLTGFTGTSGWVIKSDSQVYLLTDGRYATQARNQTSADVRIGNSLVELAQSVVEPGDVVLYDERAVTAFELRQLHGKCPKVYWLPDASVGQIRAVKSVAEVAKIRKACDRAEQALYKALGNWKALSTERDVADAIEYQAKELGAQSIPFEFIVAQAERSALPHGVASDRDLDNEPLTIDWGSEYEGYFSDQTITVVPDRTKWTTRWQELYSIVYEAQQNALAKVSQGVLCSEIDAAAREVIVQAGYGKHFVHSTGHGVGREIHEFPGIGMNSVDRLQTGMIITVEPGIYIEGFGGIRLEDTIMVAENGFESLTTIDKSEPVFLESIL